MTPEHQEQIGLFVRGGYMTVAEITEVMGEIIDDDTDPDAESETGVDRPTANEILDAVVATMEARRRELDVTIPSAYERLRQTFAVLEERGVLARENYWCCQTCAYAAIDEEIAEELDAGGAVRGYVLFHSQDTDRAVESGHLLLRYGGITRDPERDGPEASKAIGEELVALLRSSDFAPDWSGSPNDVITLPIQWDKRPPADA